MHVENANSFNALLLPGVREKSTDTRANSESPFIEWLRQFFVFHELTREECSEVAGLAQQKEMARGTLVHSEGESCRHVLLLLSGSVKIAQLGASGCEVLLHVCGPGELVGAFEASLGEENRVRAITIQSTKALVWKKPDFDTALGRMPALRRNTIKILGKRLQAMEDRFLSISTQRVASRIGQELIRLTNHLHQAGPLGEWEINLSREELAQLTGATMCTVSRLLSQWERLGVLGSRRGVVVVHDLKSLEELSKSD